MPTQASLLALIVLGAPVLLASPPAFAAGDDKKDDAAKKDDAKKDDAKKDDAKKDDAKKDDDAAKKDDAKKEESPDAKWDPNEDPAKTYRFIGLRYRDAVVPKFIINWFANGGRNVNVPMVGPEFITRRDHLEIAVALMYADYSMDPFLFQGKSDPMTSWELVASTLKLGYVMADFLYEIPIEKVGEKTGRFAFLIGGGVGIGGVFGQLYRSQAYPNSNAAATNSSDPSGWAACTGPGAQGRVAGNLSAGYCDTRTNHYAGGTNGDGNVYTGYTEDNWANGHSKPLIFPWIALPQIGFRYKPIKQFQMKADFGFSTSGFFFGLSASYGIPSKS
jgi:hypothetical protein